MAKWSRAGAQHRPLPPRIAAGESMCYLTILNALLTLLLGVEFPQRVVLGGDCLDG